jgi:swainsonine biosynthesis dioxygenase SwnH1/2
MERSEKYTDSAPRLLPPIDASYQPSRAVTKIPATSSLDEILAHLERDGGVILTDFVSLETLDKVDEELEPYMKPIAENGSYNNFIGKKTLVIPGLVGKSDTIANILDTNETIEKLLKIILEERYSAVFENHTEELVSEPLLSISLGFNIGHSSPRQALHRDDMIFSSKHRPDMKINEVDGFSCFLAGTRVTRENGGTMVILGSHKWEHDRHGRPDEVSFLGKSMESEGSLFETKWHNM